MVTAEELVRQVEASSDRAAAVEVLRAALRAVSPQRAQPIDDVRWVPVEDVEANDYNPNAVAPNEMKLLHTSISHDGYTQPVVTIRDEARGKYVIVDGFHRRTIMDLYPDVRAATGGLLPIVVIDKPVADRMASTVRHNRARGKHAIDGMANIVLSMEKEGLSEERVCAELGLEADELVRLKSTGFARLFANVEYKRSWEAEKQVATRLRHGARVSPVTVKQLLERRARLERHFQELAASAVADYTDALCPGCGERFFLSRAETERRPSKPLDRAALKPAPRPKKTRAARPAPSSPPPAQRPQLRTLGDLRRRGPSPG